MAYYQYNETNRELVQISDLALSPDTNLPVSFIEISKADLLNLYQWDKDSLGFVDKIEITISKKEFLKKFLPQEYAAVKAATSQNGVIDYYWQLFMVAENITLTDPDTIQGVNTLEQLGLIGLGRAAEILS